MGKARPAPNALWGEFYSRAKHATPFLKWAGGKRRFTQVYGRYFPSFTGKYIEPFLGGGAVFFHMIKSQERPFIARLGDTNRHLVRCYMEVRDDPHGVSQRLNILQAGYSAALDKAAFYYEVRDRFTRTHPRPDASLFIFLNQTCWNGLWRINSEGLFNVPYGAPKTDQVVPSLRELVNASAALQHSFIRATAWENTLAYAEPGDFVFLDPPYFSETLLGRDNYSDKYAKRVFGFSEHERLARAIRGLADRGVQFVLTNSAEPEMKRLYERLGLRVTEIVSPRQISGKPSDRQPVTEIVVTNAECGATRASTAVRSALEAIKMRATQTPQPSGGEELKMEFEE